MGRKFSDRYEILEGHVVEQLRSIPAESVHCVVTSPPYWGLRDYGPTLTVWGGDPECVHEWGDEERMSLMHENRNNQVGSQEEVHGATGTTYIKKFDSKSHYTCLKCGAWLGALGLEPLHDCVSWASGGPPCNSCYICHLRLVFSEVHRVLHPTGTVWLNIGDTYAGSWGNYGGQDRGNGTQRERVTDEYERQGTQNMASLRPPSASVYRSSYNGKLKPKDLTGIPWRTALALQHDGWYLRSDIIWQKPNTLPESVKDRPTKCHEYLFLLTKSRKYYYDSDAIREPHKESAKRRVIGGKSEKNKFATDEYLPDGSGGMGQSINQGRPNMGIKLEDADEAIAQGATILHPLGKNKRTVWEISTRPFTGSHFAVFPPDLVEPCIQAGASIKCCSECGTPWKRHIKRPTGFKKRKAGKYAESGMTLPGGSEVNKVGNNWEEWKLANPDIFLGWIPDCDCMEEAEPCMVLDPFCGSGTTGIMAVSLGCFFIGVELMPKYVEIAHTRINEEAHIEFE